MQKSLSLFSFLFLLTALPADAATFIGSSGAQTSENTENTASNLHYQSTALPIGSETAPVTAPVERGTFGNPASKTGDTATAVDNFARERGAGKSNALRSGVVSNAIINPNPVALVNPVAGADAPKTNFSRSGSGSVAETDAPKTNFIRSSGPIAVASPVTSTFTPVSTTAPVSTNNIAISKAILNQNGGIGATSNLARGTFESNAKPVAVESTDY